MNIRSRVKELFEKAGVEKSGRNSYGTYTYAWKCPFGNAAQLAEDLLLLYEDMKPKEVKDHKEQPT